MGTAPTTERIIEIDSESLSLEQVQAVVRQGAVVKLSEDTERKVLRSRHLMEKALLSDSL